MGVYSTMIKILVANSNIKQNFRCCENLSRDKDIKTLSTYSGITTLDKYFEINPDILVLDSVLRDMHYTEILNRLSNNLEERNACNIILTTSKLDSLYRCNIAKVFKVLHKPLKYKELSETVNLMKPGFSNRQLAEVEVEELLMHLGFNMYSNGTRYVVFAILQCYYNSNLLNNLDKLFALIAYTYNTTPASIRSCIRNSLVPVNMSRNTLNNPLLDLFDSTRNITPKYFIDIVCTYFRIKKHKK